MIEQLPRVTHSVVSSAGTQARNWFGLCIGAQTGALTPGGVTVEIRKDNPQWMYYLHSDLSRWKQVNL